MIRSPCHNEPLVDVLLRSPVCPVCNIPDERFVITWRPA